jgi:hypothetical protein
MGLIHVEEETYAAIELSAKIAFLDVQITDLGSAVATLDSRVASARISIGVVHPANQDNFAVAHSSTPAQVLRLSAEGTKIGRI